MLTKGDLDKISLAIKKETDPLKVGVNSLSIKITGVENSISKLETRVASVEKGVSKLETRVAGVERSTKRLERKSDFSVKYLDREFSAKIKRLENRAGLPPMSTF